MEFAGDGLSLPVEGDGQALHVGRVLAIHRTWVAKVARP